MGLISRVSSRTYRQLSKMTKITMNKTSSITALKTSTIAHLTGCYNSPSDSDFSEEETESSKEIYRKSGPELHKNYKMCKGYVGPVMAVSSYNLKPQISEIINIDTPSLKPDHEEIN